jgi:hypothetical protein
MSLLEDDLYRLVKNKKITSEMALLNANDRGALKRELAEGGLL